MQNRRFIGRGKMRDIGEVTHKVKIAEFVGHNFIAERKDGVLEIYQIGTDMSAGPVQVHDANVLALTPRDLNRMNADFYGRKPAA